MDELTERQREVFGQICIGQDGGHHPRTLAALAERGLIDSYRELWDGRPPVEIVRWYVPVPVHMEWARWCAEQPDGDGPD
jgi:hypothetical protein